MATIASTKTDNNRSDTSDEVLSGEEAVPGIGDLGGDESEGEGAVNERVPSVAFLLKELRGTPTFESIRDDSKHLSKTEVNTLLDADEMKWEWLRNNIIASIEENKANKKSQLPSRTKRH